MSATEPINVADYERLAAEALEPGPLGYFAGGAGDEITLRDNVEAFGRWQLRPRMLVDVSEASARTTVLGAEVSVPILVAPVAFQRMAHPDGEPGMARAAAEAGTIMCVSTLASARPAEVAAAAPEAPRWLQLYVFRDRGVTRALIDEAVEAGYRGDRADRRCAAGRLARARPALRLRGRPRTSASRRSPPRSAPTGR